MHPVHACLAALAMALAPAAAKTGEPLGVAETLTPDPSGDVIDVAAAMGQFTRFLAAVEAAGYEETLRGEGPFTIFAPTDEAFRHMDQTEVRRLMLPQNSDELRALLGHHVVRGRLTTENMSGRIVRVEAASGYHLTIDGRDGLRVNDQLVAMQDVSATNGVIQGINAVLAPPVLIARATALR